MATLPVARCGICYEPPTKLKLGVGGPGVRGAGGNFKEMRCAALMLLSAMPLIQVN